MKSRLSRVAIALAAVVALSGCSGGSNAVDQQAGAQFRYVSASKKGTVIPAATRKLAGPVAGQLLSGAKFTLAAERGHIVVLNFFATWCGPCQVETPQFDALYRQVKSTGVDFVGLDVKDGSQSATRSWLTDKQISYPVVWDQPGRTAIELGKVPIVGLPATVVIDKQGRVAAVYSGLTLPADLTPALTALGGEA